MAAMACTTASATAGLSVVACGNSERVSSTRASLQVSSFTGLRADSHSAGHQGALFYRGYGLNLDRTSSGRSASVGVRAEVASPPIPKQKIRINLKSYWVPLIERASEQILEAARNTGSDTMGPVRLPTRKTLYCVLRSPHVDKDSREHFQIKTHKRLIDLENPNAQTIDALMQLDLPAGVNVEVKLC